MEQTPRGGNERPGADSSRAFHFPPEEVAGPRVTFEGRPSFLARTSGRNPGRLDHLRPHTVLQELGVGAEQLDRFLVHAVSVVEPAAGVY